MAKGDKAIEKPAADAPGDDAAPPKKKKHHRSKRKKPQQDDEANLPPEELARRRRQKELRDVALKLRAQGKTYNHNKYRRLALTLAASGGLQDDHKPRRSHTVQVIIIPIFWNSREDEKSLVLGAAGQAQAALRHAGVKCDTDTTHKLTPGQKYRHWEERGVMIRVEIGPKEAEDGVCLLAQCKNVGEVAEKRTINLGGQLIRSVATALGMAIDAKTVEAAEKAGVAVKVEVEAARVREEARAAKHAGTGKISTEVDINTKKSNKIVFGGDDLDGDFDEAVLLGKDVGHRDGKKKKNQKSSGDSDDDGADRVEEEDETKEKKKKKKSKVVTF